MVNLLYSKIRNEINRGMGEWWTYGMDMSLAGKIWMRRCKGRLLKKDYAVARVKLEILIGKGKRFPHENRCR